VVTLRAPCGHELIANGNRKWEIREPASMQMAELSAAHAEFETAEAMRSCDNTAPRTQFVGNPVRKRISYLCHAALDHSGHARGVLVVALSGLRDRPLHLQLSTQVRFSIGNDLHRR
jgi:hypothetical protein